MACAGQVILWLEGRAAVVPVPELQRPPSGSSSKIPTSKEAVSMVGRSAVRSAFATAANPPGTGFVSN
jgi:hypothetical protein